MLRTIAYISEIAVELNDVDLDAIVTRSLAYNERLGISGILICFNDRFIQVLEGPGSAIGQLYEKIKLDPRHGNVVTVQDTTIEERAYGGWGMRRIRAEELGVRERALILEKLQVFEPQTLIDPQKVVGGEASNTFVNLLMARALSTNLSIGVPHEISSLLYATEVILARNLFIKEGMLEELAQGAKMDLPTAVIYFPTMTDLMRACVRRILPREHQLFLSQILLKRFDDKAELASFITDFIISNHGGAPTPHRAHDQLDQHGSAFTTQTAWIIAQAALEAAPREGWPFPDLDTTMLAAAIGGSDGAARVLVSHDLVSLTKPATRMRLFRSCLAAIDGQRDDEANVDVRVRATS